MENVSFDEEKEEKGFVMKRKRGLIWAGVGLAVVVLAVVGWQYWQYMNSVYYQQMKAVRELEKLGADDVMGGKTPEETLALFLDAVKKEDFDLASQYAIYGSRENVKEWLTRLKANRKLQEFIKAYSTQAVKEVGVTSDIRFAIYEGKDAVSDISMDKNRNGVWKIRD